MDRPRDRLKIRGDDDCEVLNSRVAAGRLSTNMVIPKMKKGGKLVELDSNGGEKGGKERRKKKRERKERKPKRDSFAFFFLLFFSTGKKSLDFAKNNNEAPKR